MRRRSRSRESARSFASSGGARPRKSSGCGFAKPPGRCGARKRREVRRPTRRELRQKTAVAIPPGRVQVDVQGRQQVVEVRLDGWLKCADVSKRSGPKLYKRVLELPSAVVAESKLSKEDQLLEQLRHVGDFERSQPENEDAEEKAKNVEYQKLLKLIAGCDKALKQIEKRYGKARGRERMWPGQHWQRSQDRSAAEAGDTDEEDI